MRTTIKALLLAICVAGATWLGPGAETASAQFPFMGVNRFAYHGPGVRTGIGGFGYSRGFYGPGLAPGYGGFAPGYAAFAPGYGAYGPAFGYGFGGYGYPGYAFGRSRSLAVPLGGFGYSSGYRGVYGPGFGIPFGRTFGYSYGYNQFGVPW